MFCGKNEAALTGDKLHQIIPYQYLKNTQYELNWLQQSIIKQVSYKQAQKDYQVTCIAVNNDV